MNGKKYTFAEFEQLTLPGDESTTVWRYMDLNKFASLLVEGAMHFTSAKVLRQGSDRYEGVWPKASKDVAVAKLVESFPMLGQDHAAVLEETFDALTEKAFINCWHINDDESATMWKVYGAGTGLALKSNVGKLLTSFVNWGLYIRKVVYIDPDNDAVPATDPAFFFLQKRRHFQDERELRLLMIGANQHQMDLINSYRRSEAGVYVPVRLDWMVESIYVPFDAQQSFIRIIEGLLGTFGYGHIPVYRSSI